MKECRDACVHIVDCNGKESGEKKVASLYGREGLVMGGGNHLFTQHLELALGLGRLRRALQGSRALLRATRATRPSVALRDLSVT